MEVLLHYLKALIRPVLLVFGPQNRVKRDTKNSGSRQSSNGSASETHQEQEIETDLTGNVVAGFLTQKDPPPKPPHPKPVPKPSPKPPFLPG